MNEERIEKLSLEITKQNQKVEEAKEKLKIRQQQLQVLKQRKEELERDEITQLLDSHNIGYIELKAMLGKDVDHIEPTHEGHS